MKTFKVAVAGESHWDDVEAFDAAGAAEIVAQSMWSRSEGDYEVSFSGVATKHPAEGAAS